MKKRGREPADHSWIIDGFGQMVGITHYVDRELECGDWPRAVVELLRRARKAGLQATHCDRHIAELEERFPPESDDPD